MAYYAFLDENNIVTEVIPGKDGLIEGEIPTVWYSNFRGQKCVRTYYNGTDYAGIGYTYDDVTGEFIAPPNPPPVPPFA
jgi:hypothetical protein